MANQITTTNSNNAAITDHQSLQEIAKGLRKYLVSGNKEEEANLIVRLNKNKGIINRFFQSQGQKDVQEMDAAKLRAIRANDEKIMDLHHNLYVESINIQVYKIIEIEKDRARSTVIAAKLHFLKELTDYADIKLKEIINTITASQKEMQKKFRNDMREHRVEFSDPEDVEFLEASIQQTREAMAAHMEVTKKMLSGTVDAIETKAAELAVEYKA